MIRHALLFCSLATLAGCSDYRFDPGAEDGDAGSDITVNPAQVDFGEVYVGYDFHFAGVALAQLRGPRERAEARTLELERRGVVPLVSYLAWYVAFWGQRSVHRSIIATSGGFTAP